jgi:hypothetical protein
MTTDSVEFNICWPIEFWLESDDITDSSHGHQYSCLLLSVTRKSLNICRYEEFFQQNLYRKTKRKLTLSLSVTLLEIMQGSFKWKLERSCLKWFTVTLIFSEVCTAFHRPPPTFHSGINFSGERRLLVAVPTSNAPPPLSPHPIRSDVHVECLSGAKRDENL